MLLCHVTWWDIKVTWFDTTSFHGMTLHGISNMHALLEINGSYVMYYDTLGYITLHDKMLGGVRWYGMTSHGLVWYDMVWFNMAWIWRGIMIWYGMALDSHMAWYMVKNDGSVTWYRIVHHGMIGYGTVRYGVTITVRVRYDLVRYRYGILRYRVVWYGRDMIYNVKDLHIHLSGRI